MSKLVTINCQIIERHERAVIAMIGLPARPAIIPLAGVDFEPSTDILAESGSYRASMPLALARENGLLI